MSDLHVRYSENREIAAAIAPRHPDDWLIVAGDVDEKIADVVAVLADLRGPGSPR